jgi:GntR family transcriptional regulator
MQKVNRNSPVPLYEQIKQILRERILDGDLAPGSRLPTEQELCDHFDVSRITIKRALDDLAVAGLVRRMQGKGSVVEGVRKIEGGLDVPIGFSEIIRRQGLKPGSEILSMELKAADTNLRETFGVLPGAPTRFMSFRRRLLIQGRPAALLNTVVPEELGKRMLKFDLDNASFYSLYAQIYGREVVRSEADLTPIVASPEIATLLQVEPGTAHIHYRSVNYLEGDFPVELCMGVYSGDIFQWRVNMYQIREEQVQHLASKPAFPLKEFIPLSNGSN